MQLRPWAKLFTRAFFNDAQRIKGKLGQVKLAISEGIRGEAF